MQLELYVVQLELQKKKKKPRSEGAALALFYSLYWVVEAQNAFSNILYSVQEKEITNIWVSK